MDWQSLSKPLELGGWGIKNLDWFSASLRLKSLWMVLNVKGLWSQVIIAKYLKNLSLDRWLRYKVFIVIGPSVIWNGFLHTLSWLGRFMGWQVGNDKDILVGSGPIIGTSSSPYLPQDLIDYL